MASILTFYLSRILGNKVIAEDGAVLGKLQDLVVDVDFIRPRVIAAKVKAGGTSKMLDFSNFEIIKGDGQYIIRCKGTKEVEIANENTLFLVKHILDKQIVDMDGRKLVRVNDLRLAVLSDATIVAAVDVGVEGLLRRLGIAKPIKSMLKPIGKNVPSKLILWDEVETIDFSNAGIKLSKAYSKLSTLHPSDLADIIEDLDSKTQVAVFSALDEERAADVLEELEVGVQVNMLESLSVEKAADVLEKMPTDEIADLLDEMEEDKAEDLLREMESEVSEEVRELMEYPDNTVGSIMTTEFLAFNENMTVDETIEELRKQRPEADTIYYLYILDDNERFIATVSLRDIVISAPETKLNQIMIRKVIHVHDDDKIDSLAQIISKYSLLALPVVDHDMKMLGMVVIDDVVYNLLKRNKKRL